MYPDTRGRISTDSTGSSRPVNSSHSFTSFSTTVTTLTGNGGAPLFAGDLPQSTTIRDTAANAATVSSLFTMMRIVRLYFKECEQFLAHFVFQNRTPSTRRRDHRVVELHHECVLVWSGVLSESLCLLDDDLVRIGSQ